MTIEEAIERLNNRYMSVSMCVNSDEARAENEAMDMAIAALREQSAKDGWISVKDRLPAPDKEVLLIAHGWASRTTYIGSFHHTASEKSWLTGIESKESDWQIWGWSYLKEPHVTHWMPLPEPPEQSKMNG